MTSASHSVPDRYAVTHSVGYQAFRLLQIAFVVAPIVAGIDKFFDKFVNWDKYVAPQAVSTLDGHVHTFMMIVGIVEIVAGLGVAIWPKIFSYVVAIWLLLIIINLLMTGMYFDIALRDLGLLLGALALGRLSMDYDVHIKKTRE